MIFSKQSVFEIDLAVNRVECRIWKIWTVVLPKSALSAKYTGDPLPSILPPSPRPNEPVQTWQVIENAIVTRSQFLTCFPLPTTSRVDLGCGLQGRSFRKEG